MFRNIEGRKRTKEKFREAAYGKEELDFGRRMTIFERNSGFKNNTVLQLKIKCLQQCKKEKKNDSLQSVGDFHMFIEKKVLT